MDWHKTEEILAEMSLVYSRDNIRKITYNKEIFPLAFRFATGERSKELYTTIHHIYKQLIYNPDKDKD